jgi:ribosomal protein S18 acetylase RimI-like enzyme
MSDSTPDTRAPNLVVRPAELVDLDFCLTLDPSYSTESVWQMDLRGEEGHVTVTFRTVRLPRSMRVSYPHDREQLVAGWRRCDGFLVAEKDGQIIGYAALTAHAPEDTVSISDLVVARVYRRQGIGTALLNAASEWAKSRNLRWLVMEAQTKNHPAIRFCEKHGFAFCGFNDHYYANQDIAVFFARSPR